MMPKVRTLEKSYNADAPLGLSNRPYLTVSEVKTRNIRVYIKRYPFGELLIRTFPKPLPDTSESRSKPPINEGQRIQDGLSKRGKSRINRSARLYQKKYGTTKMITLGYGDVSLSGDIKSKADLDRFLKTLRRYCLKKYGEFHYVWVAEIQEKRLTRTGKRVIHYHVMTPHFIPKKLINKAWNNAVNKPRLKASLPTQKLYPQIISCYNAGAYMAKYCQKEGHLIKGNGYNMSQTTSDSIKPEYQQCFDVTAEQSYNLLMYDTQGIAMKGQENEPLQMTYDDNTWFKWFPSSHEYAFQELIGYTLEGKESLKDKIHTPQEKVP